MLNKDVIWLGPAPAEEDCAQIGDPDYREQAFAECRQYITAIKRKCGEPPEGAVLRMKSQPHDYGTYYEVIVEFEPTNDAAVEWAYRVDDSVPVSWAEVGMTRPSHFAERSR